MVDTAPEVPPATSSTSTEDVDKGSVHVGPEKLAGKRPAPVESKPERVGPEKVRRTRRGKPDGG